MAAIYLIEFPLHPGLFYIGKTNRYPITKRVYEHGKSEYKNHNDNLCRWYRKNKIDLVYCILEEGPLDIIDELESFYIKYFKWLGINLTNHYDGVTKSVFWTQERRIKHSEFRKQHKFSDETKLKMKNSKLGREVTWGDRISKGKKGKPNPFEPEHLKNLQQSRRENNGHSIYQLDLNNNIIKQWDLITDAANYLYSLPNNKLTLNSLRNGIKDCCTKRQLTAAGYRWAYIEDNIETTPPIHTKYFLREGRGRPKGYKISEKTKQKISNNRKGKFHFNKNSLKILKIDKYNGEILNTYNSISEAARSVDLNNYEKNI